MLLRRLLVALFVLALVAQSAVGGVAPILAGAHHCTHAKAADGDHATKCPCCGDGAGAFDCAQVCAPVFVGSIASVMMSDRVAAVPSAVVVIARGRTTLPSTRPPIA